MILILACFVFYKLSPQNRKSIVFFNGEKNNLIPKNNSVYSTIPNNIFMNPHTPPLKINNYFPRNNTASQGIPININTQGIDTAYGQIGILTRLNGEEMILPIMGRSLFSNRGKWQYYTMSNKSNAIKLPMSHNGRSCTNEYGCDELMSGDTVYVEGYKDAFKVTIYENSQPRYIPYL
tara:strand:+ start:600 stop:1133 length:534 start_codon:yes stop_codon:yes gene_type:complete